MTNIVYQPELRPLYRKQVHASNAVLSEVVDDTYVTKSKDIGLARDTWPKLLTTNLGNGADFALVSILPMSIRRYHQLGSPFVLLVLSSL